MATVANALVVMTKLPESGRSKTRLVPPLSFDEAAEVARALLTDQLNNLTKFTAARLFIAFTPDSADGLFENLVAGEFSCFPQRGHSLGERMRHAFQQLFNRGFNNVVLIGSDLPVIPLSFFEGAYASLEESKVDVVLGPSTDGGYYLIGMNRLISNIFEGIPWSSGDVLNRTIEKLLGAGIKYRLLPLWSDIDTPEDLEHLQSQRTFDARVMKNTFALLNALKRTGRL
jgi:rSAM/selenodomain-associated transferase 1